MIQATALLDILEIMLSCFLVVVVVVVITFFIYLSSVVLTGPVDDDFFLCLRGKERLAFPGRHIPGFQRQKDLI
jgi:hypothetical protein